MILKSRIRMCLQKRFVSLCGNWLVQLVWVTPRINSRRGGFPTVKMLVMWCMGL